jgi:hypothetical protein
MQLDLIPAQFQTLVGMIDLTMKAAAKKEEQE